MNYQMICYLVYKYNNLKGFIIKKLLQYLQSKRYRYVNSSLNTRSTHDFNMLKFRLCQEF